MHFKCKSSLMKILEIHKNNYLILKNYKLHRYCFSVFYQFNKILGKSQKQSDNLIHNILSTGVDFEIKYLNLLSVTRVI